MAALPPPPEGFGERHLHIEHVDPSALVRLAGPAMRSQFTFRRDARYRFDAPRREFGVLYAAFDLRTAFVESVLRDRPQSRRPAERVVLAQKELERRRVVTYRPRPHGRPLRLITLRGAGLAAAGIDNRIATVDDYPATRTWSLAFHRHPLRADGLLYLSRFLGDGVSVVLFDRARPALQVAAVTPLQSHALLGAILDEFDIGLERPAPRMKRRNP